MESVRVPLQCPVFDRIVCAIDGSAASFEAARQAGILRGPHGSVDLVGFVELGTVGYSIYGGSEFVSDAERVLASKLEEARAICPEASSELLHGPKIARLLERLLECKASLVAVGGSTRSRSVGAARGSVTTSMLHRAPSSVLVARSSRVLEAFPSSVVVGYDGSPGAEAALGVAREIADRFGARIRAVAAGEAAQAALGEPGGRPVERDERGPVEALIAASEHADLLIVGRRGLRGLRALGSVSERVGHRAGCSVLVVQEPTAGADHAHGETR